MIYLATPYTHDDPAVMLERFLQVNRTAARLMASGVHLISPISHTHPIALAGELPTSWDYWEAYDRRLIEICTGMSVVCQDGWDCSVGVTAEVNIAREFGLAVEFIDP